jgi:hypothetical protein
MVDPRELKEIMSQGAIRPETSRDREERRILEADLAVSPLAGEPLRHRVRNFRPDPEATIRGLSGPPIWMRRLREIEDELERQETELGAAWRELARQVPDPSDFARLWKDVAAMRSFARINDLIDRHNRNFPVEARLPMDPKTRDFVKIDGKSYEREPLDADWILERFPADARAARDAA